MSSAFRVGEFHGKSVLLDAGPLQTLFVLHYLGQLGLSEKGANLLIRDMRPKLVDLGVKAFWRVLAAFDSYRYSQLGLAEALRFREQSALKPHAEEIRHSALDAVVARELSEAYIKSEEYMETQRHVISSAGLPDAVHVSLLHRYSDLVLLTDDARLRHHARETADRIIVLEELLSYYEELA